MRCACGGRGVSKARVPVWEVRRRDWGEGVLGFFGLGGRRVRVEGKWPVWKVVWWRRRWPERDFGSRVLEC